MDSVLRAFVIYFFVLFITRLVGRKTLAQMTAFDFVLFLIIGEATQQALLGDDFSVTNAFVVIVTLIGIDVALSFMKQKSKWLDKVLDGVPTVLVREGHIEHKSMERARIDFADLAEAGRRTHGLAGVDEIRYAVLERDGNISVVPKKS